MPWKDLSPAEAQRALRDDPELIALDVRTEPEHASHRLDPSVLVPVQELQARVDELDPTAKYLVYCEHGMRSAAACGFLEAQGFEELHNLQGGMAHWIGTGLPYTR